MEEIDEPIKHFIDILPQVGTLQAIGIRPERKQPLVGVENVTVTEDFGLEGDHFSSTKNKKRQVTLIQAEHLDAVSSIIQKEADHLLTRRNLLVKGINLFALRNRKFKIGEVVFEGTGYCHPCKRMEENFGPGGYNAMRGHGGITAKVITDGAIKVGDPVELIKG